MFQLLVTSLALSTLVASHAIFQELWVDGKDEAASCIRMPKTNSPVANVLSPDMRCNVGGSVGVAGICDVRGMSKKPSLAGFQVFEY
jgi:lytic cellulose monooxygenase (C1-hydroxylating)